ncbi:Lrp/AsnC ligand binding domain-containing protein [Candidatus Woesearchaeota archaeon]|nr:Lrp/AsnC ligand binding domain-containing protein [Candidatus Woesearchaeota archaeon]
MTLVYLLIRADHGKEGIVKAALSKFSEITELHEIFGRYDIIARVETESHEKFRRFINNKIRVMEGIKSTEPLFVSDDAYSED